jgi:hypothetical protein
VSQGLEARTLTTTTYSCRVYFPPYAIDLKDESIPPANRQRHGMSNDIPRPEKPN